MKYLVVADIHGSVNSALLIDKLFKQYKCDNIIILGDILYHGPRNPLPITYEPKKVIEILNPLKDKIIAVRGNCDSEVDQMVLDFDIFKDFKIIDLNHRKVFLTHGHLSLKQYISNCNILISGHTHIRTITKDDGVLYLNPGSITLPKGDMINSYAILDDNSFTIYDIENNLLDSTVFD